MKKSRTLIELFEVIKDPINVEENFRTGLCPYIYYLCEDGILLRKEYKILMDYCNKNFPPSIYKDKYQRRFIWAMCDWDSRLKWINEQINKLQTK